MNARLRNLAALLWLLNVIFAWLFCALLVAVPGALLIAQVFG